MGETQSNERVCDAASGFAPGGVVARLSLGAEPCDRDPCPPLQFRAYRSGARVGRGFAERSLRAFLVDERGATAIEYGLICAMIFLVVVTGVSTLGGKMSTLYANISAAVSRAAP